MRLLRKIIILCCLWFCLKVYAVEFDAYTNTKEVRVGDVFQLVVSIDENRAGQPDFTVLNANFDILSRFNSLEKQIINGTVSISKNWTLSLSAKKQGELTIPAIEFGQDRTNPIKINVVDVEHEAVKALSAVNISVSVEGDKYYLFQEIPLTLRIETTDSFSRAELIPPEMKDFEVTVRGQDRQSENIKSGQRVLVIERDYLLRPQKAGKIDIQSFELRGNFIAERQERNGLDAFFNSPFNQLGKPFRARSNPITLDIKSAPNRESTWFLPAKSVELFSQWQPEKPDFQVGVPVNLQLDMIAVGAQPEQLPKFKIPQVDGLKIYVDRDTTEKNEGSDGSVARRKVLLSIVAERGGKFTLPAFHITWLNTSTGKTETAIIAEQQIHVTGQAVKENADELEFIKSKTDSFTTNKTPEHLNSTALKESLKNKNSGNHRLIYTLITAVLTLIVIGLIYYLVMRTKRINSDNHIQSRIDDRIDQALKNRDEKSLYLGFVDWQEHGISFSEKLKAAIYALEAKLFSQSFGSDIDFDAIQKAVEAERRLEKRANLAKRKKTLPPLYKRHSS